MIYNESDALDVGRKVRAWPNRRDNRCDACNDTGFVTICGIDHPCGRCPIATTRWAGTPAAPLDDATE